MTDAIRWKPIIIFLAVTFPATFGVELAVIAGGVRFGGDVLHSNHALWMLGTMWIPGLAAIAVARAVEKRSWKGLVDGLLLYPGNVRPYFLVVLLAPFLFGVIYGLTWLLGLGEPDPSLAALTKATGSSVPLTSDAVFKVMLPMSAVVGPMVNFLFGLGEEIGWRGFLLPRLIGLGRLKAYTILGVLWGLWHAPLIWTGFNYPGHPLGGIAMMCLLSGAFGFFLGEMTLFYRSSLLAGFIHGAVNAQGYGIWPWLFPDVNPLLGGSTGLTGVAVWLIAGWIAMKILTRDSGQVSYPDLT